MSETNAPIAPVMPKIRSQVARRDPEPRPISGVPFGGIDIVNKRDDRRYILVDKGAGEGRELICPQSMEADGWDIERWDSVEAGKGWGGYEKMYRPRDGALHFAGGSRVGPPGAPMEHRGHILMSKDLEAWQAAKVAGQRSVDPREKSIRAGAMQTKEARDEVRRVAPEKYARVSEMNDDEKAEMG